MDPFITTADLAVILDEDYAEGPGAEFAIDAACQAVRTYLGQDVNFVADDVILLDGNGLRWLRLPQRPVRAVGPVYLDDVTTADPDWFDDGHFIWRTDPYDVWPVGERNVEVTYDHGWDLEATYENLRVPADIRMVAMNSARRMHLAQGTAGAGDVTSETIGRYTYQLEKGSESTGDGGWAALLEGECRILDRYAVRLVP